VDHVHSNQYWTWVQGKWPWEGGSAPCGITRNACSIR
jgi:hypothetical protein